MPEISSAAAKLVVPSSAHIDSLMQWFPDAACVAIWSPSNSFPFVPERFVTETMLHKHPSFMLVNTEEVPLAFGQYYERLGCCHLSRLVVNPLRRQEGVGAELVSQLCDAGKAALSLQRCSLFVMQHNAAALRLYARLGFTVVPYPEEIPLPACLYMQR